MNDGSSVIHTHEYRLTLLLILMNAVLGGDSSLLKLFICSLARDTVRNGYMDTAIVSVSKLTSYLV